MAKLIYTPIFQMLLLVNTFVVSIWAQTVSVTVKNGTIFGSVCPCPFTSVVAYLGIPFAQPPVGSLRWNAPMSYNSTYPNGSINATTFSPGCYQFGPYTNEAPSYSEDW